MDPQVAVWVSLAINIAGILLMIGGKSQVIKDNMKRIEKLEERAEEGDRTKLSVEDYRRERAEFMAIYREDRHAAANEFKTQRNRIDILERGGARR